MLEQTDSKYGIPVTYECNWDCPYCITDTHSKERTFDEALLIAQEIPNWSKVTLSGGEPGLLETNQLLEIIGILRDKGCSVSISSNGEIFKHPSVMDEISHVSYHCSTNMELTDVVNREYPTKTVYKVVATDNNIANLKPFLDKHSDLSIYVYAAEKVRVKGRVGESLSTKNALMIAVKHKDRLPDNNLKYLLGSEYQQDIEIK